MDRYVIWTAFSKTRMVSVIPLLLMHAPTAYLIEVELLQCLIDVLMRWILGSQPTSIPIERDMHNVIALGVGFLGKMQEFDPDVNYPVYISEPLVVLSLSLLFEKGKWTMRQAWMINSFRNARNSSSLGFIFEEVALCVLMEVYGEKPNPLAEAVYCSESLGPRRVILVSLKRGADGVLQSHPVSWKASSSDRLGLKATSLPRFSLSWTIQMKNPFFFQIPTWVPTCCVLLKTRKRRSLFFLQYN